MRHTEFWARLEVALGAGYYRHWAANHVIGSLGGRTVEQALDAGISPKTVWRAVVEVLNLPASQR